MTPKIKKCQYCLSEVLFTKRGWRLKTRKFAKLCVTCAAVYKNGTFCTTYHLNQDGWRECGMCHRALHCGCIMSIHLYENNDTAGITCVECLKRTLLASYVAPENAGTSGALTATEIGGTSGALTATENAGTSGALTATENACASDVPVIGNVDVPAGNASDTSVAPTSGGDAPDLGVE